MKKRAALNWLVSSAALCFPGHYAGANSIDWPVLGFTQAVATSFNKPTVLANAGDESQRIFVAEQPGLIWIIKSNSVLAEPFLDITGHVLSTGFEQGLLGIAFPPGFATNSHFYVNYTRQPDGATVISRFFLTTNPNLADTNSEQIIKVIPQPYENHNGGQIAFGPDGYLYIVWGMAVREAIR
jgi:glucose/arabinose dehydrogenase